MANIEITEEMLDVIEAVKGRRNPAYWDSRCKHYMKNQENLKKIEKSAKKG